MYSKTIVVSNNDVDKHFKLKISAIFRYFQDVALRATKEIGLDAMTLSKQNIDWVITRMAVEITRLPMCEEEIVAYSYPGKDMAMLFPRYFYITDKEGNVIIRCSSVWALINNITRKVIVDRNAISKLPGEDREDQMTLPEKVVFPENSRFLEKRVIHYSDLDFNSHMNNVRYVELLMDSHDSAFYENHRLQKLTLNYMKEIKEKEAVEIYTDASNPETISVKVDGNLAFLGKATFISE